MRTALILLLLAIPAVSTTIHVPDDQPTIQAGIDAAVAGDTVQVAAGTYYEDHITLVSGIWLLGNAVDPATVVIDASGAARALV